MIRIILEEPKTKEWVKWKEKSIIKRDLLIKAANKILSESEDEKYGDEEVEKLKINDHYKHKTLKNFIFSAFYGKCAFCESYIEGDQSTAVEHFRPKGGVTNLDDKPVMISLADGKERRHLGYYWLAYDWQNLIPACNKCNTIHKKTYFPIRGIRAYIPCGLTELADEEALLLNPSAPDFDPKAHFKFDMVTGYLIGLTDEGKTTITVCGLNRYPLPDQRKKVYIDSLTVVSQALDQTSKYQEEKFEILKDIAYGKAEFSMIKQIGVAEGNEKLKNILELIGKC